MRNQGQLIAGVAIIAIGLIILFSNLLDINLWGLCWPALLIVLGLWLLLRPQMVGRDAHVSVKLIGDFDRAGAWEPVDEEFWVLVGDIDLDLTGTSIPVGETRFRTYGFVGDVELIVPRDVGVAVTSTAFVSDVKAFGDRRETFLAPLEVTSENYAAAERKVRLLTYAFVGDVKVRQV
jgi:lia operon protein LiaF